MDYQLATVSQRIEPELTAVATTITAAPTTWQRLATVVPAISSKFLADAVLSERAAFNTAMTSYQEALGVLQKVPTAELDRLLTETMDVCSHRIDAWITGLYSARLEAMREVTPSGVHLGAYAWVENLRARFDQRTTPVTLPDGRQVVAQLDNGGYIHAPTMTHAAAAAVLRNAYLSQAGGNGQRYEIDLSSARVRQATFMLDGCDKDSRSAQFSDIFSRATYTSNSSINLSIISVRSFRCNRIRPRTPACPPKPWQRATLLMG